MYRVFWKVFKMKITKLLILVSAATLVACGPNNATTTSEESKYSSLENSSATSETTTNQVTSESTNPTASNNSANSSNNSSASSSSNQFVSSTSSSSSSSGTTTSAPADGESLVFGFYNPNCTNYDSAHLNDGLKSYMNGIAGTTFVSAITNTNCQIMASAPTNGNSRLTIGSAKAGGELEFTLSTTIKSVTIEAETYYKYYSNANHADGGAVCYVNTDTNVIDLAPQQGNDPVVKQFQLSLNSNKLKLYNKDANTRAFIKTITFVY